MLAFIRRGPGRIILALAGWCLLATAIQIVTLVLTLAILMGASSLDETRMNWGAVTISIAVASTFLLLLADRGVRRLPQTTAVPQPSPVKLAVLIVAALALTELISLAVEWMGLTPPPETLGFIGSIIRAGDSRLYPLVLLVALSVVVLAPVGEELMFRQWFWRRLEPFGLRTTMLVTGAAFVAAHLPGWHELIGLAAFTAMISWARWRWRSPRPGMWLHAANNALAIAEIASDGLPDQVASLPF